MTNKLKLVASAMLIGMALAGCSSSVTLSPPTIPTPLITKIPIDVGIRMPPQFDHFVHEEDVLGRETWSIDLGRSHAALFTQLFAHMFQSLTVLGADDDPALLDIDALIEPSIDAFEFSVPTQSKTDSFAVWIRYRLKIYNRDGELFANWPVSAYGKSQKTGIGGSDALQRAAVLAMRDAAALMIMQLDKATAISTLAGATQTSSIGAEIGDGAQQTTTHGGSSDETG